MDRAEILEKIEKKKDLGHSHNTSMDTEHKAFKYSQSKPLFKRLEAEYKQNILLPELNKSKEVLIQRHEYMHPIHHTELIKHERKYLSDLDCKMKQLKKARKHDRSATSIKLEKYNTKLTEKIRERDFLDSVQEKRKKEDRLRIKEKMMLYAQIAMDSHRPKVSAKKQQELKDIVNKLHHKPRKPNPKSFERRPMYLNSGTPNSDGKKIKLQNTSSKSRFKKSNKSDQSKQMSHTNTPVQNSSKFKDDWNTKLRIKREQMEEEHGIKRSPNLVNMLIEASNIDGHKDKAEYDLIKEKVKVIEQQAFMKEKVLDTKAKDIEAYDEVNDMIITSIKAKLALLKGI